MSLTERVGLRLPTELYKQLEEAARGEERTVSSLVRHWIRQRLERRDDTGEVLPIAPRQLSAIHARAGEIDGLLEQPVGISKRLVMRAASAHFGVTLESTKTLTYEQASWVLDYLEDQREHAREQRGEEQE